MKRASHVRWRGCGITIATTSSTSEIKTRRRANFKLLARPAAPAKTTRKLSENKAGDASRVARFVLSLCSVESVRFLVNQPVSEQHQTRANHRHDTPAACPSECQPRNLPR